MSRAKPTTLFDVAIFNRATQYIFEKGMFTDDMFADKPLNDLRNETVRCLVAAIDDSEIETHLPTEMAEKLREDVFIFSGCKTYHEIKEVSQLLLDDLGKVKPLPQFTEQVKSIHETYNVLYLEAEYNFAIASAQSAARWADFEADGDQYDLQYRTANDDRVRQDHAALDGITLPPSDPFWSEYMPPNGWRCRCSVSEVLKDKYTKSDSTRAIELGRSATTEIDASGRNRSQMFRFNPGAQRVVFPPEHPYYNNIPEELK